MFQQFKVEAAQQQYYGPQAAPGFCADLTLEGSTYKGYGEPDMPYLASC
jgi:hypothetical protein